MWLLTHNLFIFPRFLGYIDKIGIAYNDPTIASGYGAYIAAVRIQRTSNAKSQCLPTLALT